MNDLRMFFKRSATLLAAAGVALCLIPSLLHAQVVNATLLGTVTDASGAVVTSARVTALEQNTGVSHATETNGSGNYVFPDTPPGTYTIIVELAGFKKDTRKGVALMVNSSQRVDFQLQPGDVSQTVEVTAAVPLLQTDRSDTGRNLDSSVVQTLPLSTNRNYQSLLNLVPGVAYTTIQHSQFFNASSSLQTEVNGGARMVNNYMIEGIDDNERTGLLQVVIPPIEAIQTVDVSTSNHDVVLGRSAGAVTNVILKSGTKNGTVPPMSSYRTPTSTRALSSTPALATWPTTTGAGRPAGPSRRTSCSSSGTSCGPPITRRTAVW